MLTLDTPIQFVKGVGPKMAPRLAKLGIQKLSDLIFHYPRTWLDLRKTFPISQTRLGQEVVIRARIIDIKNEKTPRKRMVLTKAWVEDDSGQMLLLWFNQPFLLRNLQKGQHYHFHGRVSYDFSLAIKTIQGAGYEQESGILPIYRESGGVSSRYIRRIIKVALEAGFCLVDFLSKDTIRDQNLATLQAALQEVHFPTSFISLGRAKERLAFDELFLISLKMLTAKRELASHGAPSVSIDKSLLKGFVDGLPYRLTNAQRRVSWEIIQDLAKSQPMNRLLEGDVGSGKTVVAAMAALAVIKNGYQVVWMAPTEILATQHYENVEELLKPFNINIALLTANQVRVSSKSRSSGLTKSQLKSLSQNSNLIIGTHALIQDKIKFANLGLVIIDEQHRFGVRQRAALRSNKLKANGLIPHFLSMTATPIPRTLALSLYGDLAISILDEMPPGRARTITRLVDPLNRDKAYEFIRDQVKMGRQVFVICPLIEKVARELQGGCQGVTRRLRKTDLFDIDRKSVKKEYEKLSKEVFPDLKIAMLHGRMKSKEKEEIMRNFRGKKIDIIVSTSVIEVGIDIANATVMMIEDAERFGLSQLHQFRGRVGRGRYTSYCLLFTVSLSEEAKRRLKALEECADGFRLAEKDLVLRGPGEMIGNKQHGIPDLKMASLTDIMLIKRVRAETEKIISRGLEQYPRLLEKLKEFQTTRHLE